LVVFTNVWSVSVWFSFDNYTLCTQITHKGKFRIKIYFLAARIFCFLTVKCLDPLGCQAIWWLFLCATTMQSRLVVRHRTVKVSQAYNFHIQSKNIVFTVCLAHTTLLCRPLRASLPDCIDTSFVLLLTLYVPLFARASKTISIHNVSAFLFFFLSKKIQQRLNKVREEEIEMSERCKKNN